MREDVVTPHLVVQDVKSSGRLLLGLHIERSLEPPNLVGSCQAHANLPLLGSFQRTPNQGPFPPPALPGFLSTLGPSDACRTQSSTGPLATPSASAAGLPCCQFSRAYVLRPLPRRAERPSCVGASGRSRRPSSMERDSALALDLSRLAQASLALRPVRVLTRQSGPVSPGLRWLGHPHHRPGRYPGAPTRPGAGLAPAA